MFYIKQTPINAGWGGGWWDVGWGGGIGVTGGVGVGVEFMRPHSTVICSYKRIRANIYEKYPYQLHPL